MLGVLWRVGWLGVPTIDWIDLIKPKGRQNRKIINYEGHCNRVYPKSYELITLTLHLNCSHAWVNTDFMAFKNSTPIFNFFVVHLIFTIDISLTWDELWYGSLDLAYSKFHMDRVRTKTSSRFRELPRHAASKIFWGQICTDTVHIEIASLQRCGQSPCVAWGHSFARQ